MATFYKGFLIKQGLKATPESAPKFIATLQGVRFTAFTVTELHNKIDRNHQMIADMSNQGFKSNNVIKSESAAYDLTDDLVPAYEIAEIVRSYSGRAYA